MTEPSSPGTFDPYHKWLGIPAKDQPPHHYRLLAIDLFEQDPDVIAAAADKQMAYIRSFQTGKNSQSSQKILNEIAAARVCLLNAVKKAEYDGGLRTRLAGGVESGIGMVGSALAGAENTEVILLAETDVHASSSRPIAGPVGIAKTKSRTAILAPLAALGALLAICGVAIAVVMSRTPKTQVSLSGHDSGDSPTESESAQSKPSATLEVKPQSSADPASSRSPLRPFGSHQGTAAAPPSPAAELSSEDHAFVAEPNVPPSGSNHEEIKPDIAADPVANTSDSFVEPKSEAESPDAGKIKTAEKLDKLIADAKTTEDYQVVADAALQSAVKAVDERQDELARTLIVKALAAARKSEDSKLIVKVTRALIRPKSIREILTEEDTSTAEPIGPVTSPFEHLRGTDFSDTRTHPSPAPSSRANQAVPSVRKIALSGSSHGHSLGAVRRGTVIILQYESGTWRGRTLQQVVSPDATTVSRYRMAITTGGSNPQVLQILPTGTINRPFTWRADRDYDSLMLRSGFAGTGERLSGLVHYQVTIQPSVQ